MFKQQLFISGLFLLIIASASMVHAQDPISLEHDGFDRQYTLHIPENYDGSTPVPLMVMLHGAGMTPVQMQLGGGFDEIADEQNVIMAYPGGLQLGWNYLDEEELHPADLFTRDWDFVETMIDDIIATYNIDESRIYAAGYSNGGSLILRMICEYPDRLAGVAVIGANFSFKLSQHCLEADPVPVMFVLGTQDQVFPWSGYVRMTDDGRFKSIFSMSQTIGFLRTLYRCESHNEPIRIEHDTSPVAVVADHYTDCGSDADVLLYALIDHRHDYPYRPIVTLSDDESGTIMQAIWQFFESHRRRN